MTERGWGIEALAHAAEIGVTTVHDFLNNGTSVYRRTARRVSEALEQTSVEAILLKHEATGSDEIASATSNTHEWFVEQVVSPWITASNGLQFQICRMKHAHLDRLARGKRYELQHLSTADRERAHENLLRHPKTCEKVCPHPHVIRNLTTYPDETGTSWWVIDEWIEGQTLHDQLSDGAFTHSDCRRLMLGMAFGLAALHDEQIVRRELTPAAVLVRAKDGEAVLTEFELAKLLDGSPTVSSANWPTDPYRAPEADSDDIDLRADLYNWGRISLHLLHGELPPPDTHQSVVGHLRLPGPLSTLLVSCLEVSRRKRPNTIAPIVDALTKWKVR